MAEIERRSGDYRACYYDPLGRRHSKTFARRADAERFLRELRVEMDRGHWLDPKGAELTVAEWSEELLLLSGGCRRRPRPPTGGTSSATCCRASPPTASGACRRTRSRTS